MSKKLVCIDNSGACATYGVIAEVIENGEQVELIDTIGCCHHVKTKEGRELFLNQERFEKA